MTLFLSSEWKRRWKMALDDVDGTFGEATIIRCRLLVALSSLASLDTLLPSCSPFWTGTQGRRRMREQRTGTRDLFGKIRGGYQKEEQQPLKKRVSRRDVGVVQRQPCPCGLLRTHRRFEAEQGHHGDSAMVWYGMVPYNILWHHACFLFLQTSRPAVLFFFLMPSRDEIVRKEQHRSGDASWPASTYREGSRWNICGYDGGVQPYHTICTKVLLLPQ